MLPNARGTSKRALHITGTSVQYAGAGCHMKTPAAAYRATFYGGIEFFAKGTASAPKIIVQTAATESTMYGGRCTLPVLSCAGNETSFPLNPDPETWTQIGISYAWLKNGTAPFDANEIWSIEFQPGPGAFDLWIDDLRFAD